MKKPKYMCSGMSTNEASEQEKKSEKNNEINVDLKVLRMLVAVLATNVFFPFEAVFFCLSFNKPTGIKKIVE